VFVLLYLLAVLAVWLFSARAIGIPPFAAKQSDASGTNDADRASSAAGRDSHN